MNGFNDTGTFVSNTRQAKPAWDKDIQYFEFPEDGMGHKYRLVAKPFFFSQHWVEVKKQDGKTVSVPFVCKNWDSNTNEFVDRGCVHCQFMSEAEKVFAGIKKDKWPSTRVSKLGRKLVMLSNVIVRDLQQAGPPMNNTGAWSFIKPMRFSPLVFDEIKSLAEKYNRVKTEAGEQIFNLNHAQYGRDVMIAYDKHNKDPKKKYSTQINPDPNQFNPLTEQEMSHAGALVDFSKYLQYPDDADCKDILEKQGFYKDLEDYKMGAALGNFQAQQMQQAPQYQQGYMSPGQPTFQMPQMGMPQMQQMPQQPMYQQGAPAQYPYQQGAPTPQMQQAPVAPQAPQMPQVPQAPAMGMNANPPYPPQMPQAPVMDTNGAAMATAPQMPQMPQMPQAPVAPVAPQMPQQINPAFQ